MLFNNSCSFLRQLFNGVYLLEQFGGGFMEAIVFGYPDGYFGVSAGIDVTLPLYKTGSRGFYAHPVLKRVIASI